MNIEMYVDKALISDTDKYNEECAAEFDGTGDPEKDISNWEEWTDD